MTHSQSGFNALRHELLAYRTPARPALYREMNGNLVTARNVLDGVREGRIDVGPLDAYWHLLIARHAPELTAGVRVLASTPLTPMPAFVAASAAPPGQVPRAARGVSRCRSAAVVCRARAELLLEGFAAVSARAYAPLLEWDREARAAGFDEPALRLTRLLARHPAGRVQQLVVRPEQEAPRDVEVAAVDQAAVLGEQPRARQAIARRVLVPGDGRRLVVQRVQVVEEKHRTQDPRALDDRDALARRSGVHDARRRSGSADAVRRDRHREQVDPQRHAAHELHPHDHRDAPQQVLDPERAQALLVAATSARASL